MSTLNAYHDNMDVEKAAKGPAKYLPVLL